MLPSDFLALDQKDKAFIIAAALEKAKQEAKDKETKKDDLENIVISSITASSSIGFGMGMIIGSFDIPNLPLSACFILFGILVAIPKKHKNDYLKDYEDIEEKRELIKKWWQEKNN